LAGRRVFVVWRFAPACSADGRSAFWSVSDYCEKWILCQGLPY